MVIAVVGSGGKTTLIKKLAEEYRLEGKKVVITTTTHMFVEEDTLLTDDADEIIEMLNKKGYVMTGTLSVTNSRKFTALSTASYQKVCAHADVVLVEADGSKHMPLKYPASHEPVIPDNTDEIIVVTGLWAIDKPAKEVCHRLELVKKCLGIDDNTLITKEHILTLLEEGYRKPLSRLYPQVKLTIHPVHDSSNSQKDAANWILSKY